MSKTLRYTLVGEGFAEYQFIPAYMTWAAAQTGDLQIVKSNIQIPITKNSSVSKVLQEAAKLCNQSFADTRNPCDLFLAGIDLDKPDFTDDLEYHAERIRELKEKMGKVYRQYEDRTVLYVPVQAIDCWVWYVQHKATANSLESTGKGDTKKAVYGSNNPDRQRIEKVVREAAAQADFAKLAKQSRSFAHFHKQVNDFLEHYKTSST